MAEILRGAPAAAAITEALRLRCNTLIESGITPTLAIVRVGAREDDIAYEQAAVRRCEKIGITVRTFPLQEGDESGLLETIDAINADDSIHGCLVFRPLKNAQLEQAVCSRLSAKKDVDGMTPQSMAHVYSGSGDGFAPCTAEACIRLLEYYNIPLSGKRVVILGRSLVVGKPLAMMLLAKHATVTVCHSKTAQIHEVAQDADILVAALGKAGLVDRAFLQCEQTVIDVGIHESPDGSITGDVCAQDAAEIVKAYSPVPGGVGSMTTTVLAEHVLRACEDRTCNSFSKSV